jgi:hypothetical protein
MIRFFARWRAKRRYIWAEELEAAMNDLTAAAADTTPAANAPTWST